MKSIWLWVLVPTALLFYVAFQLASVSSRMATLEDRLARMELRWAAGDEPAATTSGPPVGSGSATEPARSHQDPTLSPASVSSEELAALRAEVAALKANPAPASDSHIREVVARQQDEVMGRQLDFQQEQWIAARDGGLARFAADASLTQDQRTQLKTLLDEEAERVVDLLRQRNFREDPERLAVAWDEVLTNTDYEVRGLLADWQQARWDEARAFERAMFLPFLPRKE